MTKLAVLVRDRETGGIVRLRIHAEPVKLRVCRACGRVHTRTAGVCKGAA